MWEVNLVSGVTATRDRVLAHRASGGEAGRRPRTGLCCQPRRGPEGAKHWLQSESTATVLRGARAHLPKAPGPVRSPVLATRKRGSLVPRVIPGQHNRGGGLDPGQAAQLPHRHEGPPDPRHHGGVWRGPHPLPRGGLGQRHGRHQGPLLGRGEGQEAAPAPGGGEGECRGRPRGAGTAPSSRRPLAPSWRTAPGPLPSGQAQGLLAAPAASISPSPKGFPRTAEEVRRLAY